MRKLVRASASVCNKCKYHIGFGSQPGKWQTNGNICCDYLLTEGHSRIFENGSEAYDPKYCDNFEAGAHVNKREWNTDNMTEWRIQSNLKEELRKHEENYYY